MLIELVIFVSGLIIGYEGCVYISYERTLDNLERYKNELIREYYTPNNSINNEEGELVFVNKIEESLSKN